MQIEGLEFLDTWVDSGARGDVPDLGKVTCTISNFGHSASVSMLNEAGTFRILATAPTVGLAVGMTIGIIRGMSSDARTRATESDG